MSDASQGGFDRLVRAATRAVIARPGLTMVIGFLVFLASWGYASQLKIKGSFVELLPNESPTTKRFRETQSRRSGSASTLLVMIQSPDEEANRRYADAAAARIETQLKKSVGSVEVGPGEVREFFENWRWLFPSVRDLALVECELYRYRLKATGTDLGLSDPCEEVVDDEVDEDLVVSRHKQVPDDPSAIPKQPDEAEPPPEIDPDATPLARFEQRVDGEIKKLDRFPKGYYQLPDGTIFAILVRAAGAGMGELSSDGLLKAVRAIVADSDPSSFHPEMKVGLAGDIPTAADERQALVNDIAIVSAVAVTLILASIVFFFRSFLSLFHIGICVATGTGLAFAAAMAAYGHLNAATSFLGSIIAGNGINHGIVYLARFRERRAEGDSVEAALEDAASSTRKGTWLAALAASGSFGSLLLTSFRGFSEFGLIGGVGMVGCWVATFLILPASIMVFERRGWGMKAANVKAGAAAQANLAGAMARLSKRMPGAVLAGAALVTVAAVIPLPGYVSDPWEYDFSKLRSKSSGKRGAGHWSNKANDVFGARGAPMLVLSDAGERTEALAQAILERDRELTGGTFINRVETLEDSLGGAPDVVEAKLEYLEQIRDHLDRLKPRLSEADKERAERWRPRDDLRALTLNDLPPLVASRHREQDGTEATAIYVHLNRHVSRSNGHNLLKITDMLEAAKLEDGRVAPNASRGAVFAAMIRSMERDGPRATLAALVVVLLVTLSVTFRLVPAATVIVTLLVGIVWTVGLAAWMDQRLNFLNFIALPLTFGICVEYAINLYERMRVHHGDVEKGIASAGGAVFLCSLTTILGYGSLLFADSRALGSFGRYAIAGELGCIFTALLVMPAVLTLLKHKPAPE